MHDHENENYDSVIDFFRRVSLLCNIWKDKYTSLFDIPS